LSVGFGGGGCSVGLLPPPLGFFVAVGCIQVGVSVGVSAGVTVAAGVSVLVVGGVYAGDGVTV